MRKISNKIIRDYKQQKLNHIIKSSEFRNTKDQLEILKSELEINARNKEFDPNHKIYSRLQNLLSIFCEEITIRKEFNQFYDELSEMEEAYMASYPPLSPLTGSYYTYCCFCDFEIRAESETIGSIFYDLANEMNDDKLILKGLENLNKSSIRFYKNLGIDKDSDLVLLKDIMTGEEYSCISTSKYLGKKGEIWLVRLAPCLDEIDNCQIILTTPYVILKYKEKDWIEFFNRQGIKSNEEDKYLNFMKKNENYWHDYIMDGYVNYEYNCIYLTGIPDIKGSKPHEL